MAWQRLSVIVPDTQAEPLADRLGELGAASVTITEAGNDQPLFEPGPGETPLWRRSRVMGLFEDGHDLHPIIDVAGDEVGIQAPRDWAIDRLQDQVWERVWMDDFHAQRLGQRLWVCPSWEQPPDPDAVNILMDPGLAFGSGTHQTTMLCLRWLDANIRGGERLIDFGCGSGILAIAALKLGAAEAWCVDNDPQALIATADNARRNGVSDRIHAQLPDAPLPPSVSLLIANILASPLMQLAPRLSALVEPGGAIVLSGILDSQREQVAAHYSDHFTLDADSPDDSQIDEWVRISGTHGT